MSFDNRSSAVEGNSSSNPEMQTLCKTGCGFYGNPVQEGLCSKCHKDKVKHLQQNLPSNSSSTACVVNSTVQSEARFLRNSSSSLLVSSKNEKSSESSGGGAVSPHRETSEDQQRTSEPVVEQASPELLTAATNNIVISSTESTAYTELEASTAKPKNRCLACNKRVGLTGFGCRCGGLFCSTHRYSDMHGCSFDYKEHAQGQIRKNNPVVMGSKITKI